MQGSRLFVTGVCPVLICKGTAQRKPVVPKRTVFAHKITTHWYTTINEAGDVESCVDHSSPLVSNLFVNTATMDDVSRSVVLLKVVPLRLIAENGNTRTTYGLLDSAAVSSIIGSLSNDNGDGNENVTNLHI